jgi:hypothetical protein
LGLNVSAIVSGMISRSAPLRFSDYWPRLLTYG